MKVENKVQSGTIVLPASSKLTGAEKLASMWSGTKNMLKDLIYEDNEISLKKIGNLALTASLFAVGSRVAVAKGFVKAATVSKSLIGLGVGYGGYEVYNGVNVLKGAASKDEQRNGWEKIGAGSSTALLSLLPAKPLTRGLSNLQKTSNITGKPSMSEVLAKALDNKSLLETFKDIKTSPLFLYGVLGSSIDFKSMENK